MLSFAAGGVAGDSFLRGRVILAALIGTSLSTVWLALSQNYNSLLFGKVLRRLLRSIACEALLETFSFSSAQLGQGRHGVRHRIHLPSTPRPPSHCTQPPNLLKRILPHSESGRLVSTTRQVANGICIGILVPPLQSLVGDLHDQVPNPAALRM